jgi:lipopolysaccharide transport system permease protein
VLALVLMIAASAVWINQISLFLILLPLYFVVIGLLAVGLGWIVASLHVFLRDTAQVVSVLLIFWFWLTPIFITEKQFPPWARFLLVANPLYYVVTGYRTILLGSGMPGLKDLAIAAGYGVAVFIVGGLFFRHMKRGFADVL